MKILLTLWLTISIFCVVAQFESKKIEKLYYALDAAYMDYDYPKILDKETDIQIIFLSKEDTVAANMYSFLAEAYYYELGDLQTALDYYNLELALRKKKQPEESHTTTIFNIANILQDLGHYAKAESMLKKVVISDEQKFGKESKEYFTSAQGLIELYMRTEKSDVGLKVAFDLRKYTKKRPYDEASVLKTIGDFYETKGLFKKAQKYLLDAIDIFEENGLEATFEYAATLNSLGILYAGKGMLPESEEIFEKAIENIDRLQGENDDARYGIEESLSRVQMDMGYFDEAIATQRKVLAFNKEYYGEESFDYGITLLNLSRSLMYADKNNEADKLLQQALNVFEKSDGKKSIDYGRVLSLLANNSMRTEHVKEAIGYGESAIEIYEAALGSNHWETAYPHFFLANAFMITNQMEEAELHVKKAYDIRAKALGKKHPVFAKSSLQRAVLNWKKGESNKALRYFKETFNNYFGQINAFFPVLTEEEKATFYYTNLRPSFEQYVSFIEEESTEMPTLLGEIYDYQLALKGLILYSTTKVRQSILNSSNEALIAKFEEWIGQKEQLAKLYSKTGIDLQERNRKIDSITMISNVLEEELIKSSEAFGNNFAHRNISWKDIQSVLKPNEAAIEIVRYRDFVPDAAGIFTDTVYYAALIVKADSEYPQMVIIPNGKLMETKYLTNYRNAIKFKVKENYSYRLFWKPIANQLEGIDKIYFAGDGVYNQVSIHSFRNPKTKDYLLNELNIQLVTNTKDLLSRATSSQGKGSVFFGYPNYNMGSEADGDNDNSSEKRGLRTGKKGSLHSVVIPRGIRGNLIRYMNSTHGMALLPGTKREVEIIDSLFNNAQKQPKVFLANKALENQVKAVDNPSLLHIATHGFFLELDPDAVHTDTYVQNPLLRSGLIMAGANTFISSGDLAVAQGEEDGILTGLRSHELEP